VSVCLVWRCGRAAQYGPWCQTHADATARAWSGPIVRPMTDRETALADLLDPDRMAEDVRQHNASLATNVLLDALR